MLKRREIHEKNERVNKVKCGFDRNSNVLSMSGCMIALVTNIDQRKTPGGCLVKTGETGETSDLIGGSSKPGLR